MKMILYFLLAVALVTWLFMPDVFPRCSLCGRKKLRPFFLLHETVSIKPGYRGKKSVCRKCCSRYGVICLGDLDRVERIKRKLEVDIRSWGMRN